MVRGKYERRAEQSSLGSSVLWTLQWVWGGGQSESWKRSSERHELLGTSSSTVHALEDPSPIVTAKYNGELTQDCLTDGTEYHIKVLDKKKKKVLDKQLLNYGPTNRYATNIWLEYCLSFMEDYSVAAFTAEQSIYDETVKNKIFCVVCCRQHVLSSTQTSLGKLGDCCCGVLAISFQIFPLLPALTMINAHGLRDMTSEKY